jgi:Leucine-rich repeat (LRR) protein
LALGALTRIDISHNHLKSLPAEVFSLCSLRYLNVAQNQLEKLPLPEELSEMPSPTSRRQSKLLAQKEYSCPVLEELYLQDNRLDNIPSSIFRLPALTILDASNNKLQELPFEMWKSPKLKELNVAFNLMKDLPVLPNVSGICLWHATFSDSTISNFRKYSFILVTWQIRFRRPSATTARAQTIVAICIHGTEL